MMLYLAIVFFAAAMIASWFGFAGMATTSAILAQELFVLFCVLFLYAFITWFVYRRPVV